MKTPQNIFYWKKALIASSIMAILVALIAWNEYQRSKPPPSVRPPGTAAFAPLPPGELDKLRHHTWGLIRDNYVDTGTLSDWHQKEHARVRPIRTWLQLSKEQTALLSSLNDPHTRMLTTRQAWLFEMSHNGRTYGLGIEVDENMRVTSVLAGSPAEKSGLKVGDQLFLINGAILFSGLPAEIAMEAMRGQLGSSVALAFIDSSNGSAKMITLQRTVVYNEICARASVEPAYEPAAVRIDNLRGISVVDDLEKSLAEVNKSKFEAIILDLRGLQGGSGSTAAKVAAMFMPEGIITNVVQRREGKDYKLVYLVRDGKLVLSTTEAGKATVETIINTPVNRYPGKKILILVDHQTSGAAEIIAAALQENDRAIIWGETTAGKTTGQVNLPLTKNQVLRISNTRYNTPKDNNLQGRGVTLNKEFAYPESWFIYELAAEEVKNHYSPPPPPTPTPSPTPTPTPIPTASPEPPTTTVTPTAPAPSPTASPVPPTTSTTPTAPAPSPTASPVPPTTSTTPTAP